LVETLPDEPLIAGFDVSGGGAAGTLPSLVVGPQAEWLCRSLGGEPALFSKLCFSLLKHSSKPDRK
jgi:hypothetical protein